MSQIERGLKTPTITLLHRFARILGVRTAALLGEPSYAPTSRIHPVASEINRVLTGYDFPSPADLDLAELFDRVRSAWTIWQSSPTRFTDVSAVLPALVGDIEGACRSIPASATAEERRRVHQVAADLYFLVRTFTKRIGRVDLLLLAADRAMRTAELADDPSADRRRKNGIWGRCCWPPTSRTAPRNSPAEAPRSFVRATTRRRSP